MFYQIIVDTSAQTDNIRHPGNGHLFTPVLTHATTYPHCVLINVFLSCVPYYTDGSLKRTTYLNEVPNS